MATDKIKVYILDLGGASADLNMLYNDCTPDLPIRITKESDIQLLPFNAVLIDHPAYGKILFDLGPDPDHDETWPEMIHKYNPPQHSPEQTLEYQLTLCGTKPEEIRTVVLSHMHRDHAGNLAMFTDCEIIVQEEEFKAAMTYVFRKMDESFDNLYLRKDLTVPVKEYKLINGDYDLCEGVKIVNLPGHTEGMCGMLVNLEDFGPMFFIRDLSYTGSVFGYLKKGSMFLVDHDMYTSSIEKARRIQEETGAFMVYGHDMEQFRSMKVAPEYYE